MKKKDMETKMIKSDDKEYGSGDDDTTTPVASRPITMTIKEIIDCSRMGEVIETKLATVKGGDATLTPSSPVLKRPCVKISTTYGYVISSTDHLWFVTNPYTHKTETVTGEYLANNPHLGYLLGMGTNTQAKITNVRKTTAQVTACLASSNADHSFVILLKPYNTIAFKTRVLHELCNGKSGNVGDNGEFMVGKNRYKFIIGRNDNGDCSSDGNSTTNVVSVNQYGNMTVSGNNNIIINRNNISDYGIGDNKVVYTPATASAMTDNGKLCAYVTRCNDNDDSSIIISSGVSGSSDGHDGYNRDGRGSHDDRAGHDGCDDYGYGCGNYDDGFNGYGYGCGNDESYGNGNGYENGNGTINSGKNDKSDKNDDESNITYCLSIDELIEVGTYNLRIVESHNCMERMVCGFIDSTSSLMAIKSTRATKISSESKGEGIVYDGGGVQNVRYYFTGDSPLQWVQSWFEKRGFTPSGWWETSKRTVTNFDESDEEIDLKVKKQTIKFDDVERTVESRPDQNFTEI